MSLNITLSDYFAEHLTSRKIIYEVDTGVKKKYSEIFELCEFNLLSKVLVKKIVKFHPDARNSYSHRIAFGLFLQRLCAIHSTIVDAEEHGKNSNFCC